MKPANAVDIRAALAVLAAVVLPFQLPLAAKADDLTSGLSGRAFQDRLPTFFLESGQTQVVTLAGGDRAVFVCGQAPEPQPTRRPDRVPRRARAALAFK